MTDDDTDRIMPAYLRPDDEEWGTGAEPHRLSDDTARGDGTPPAFGARRRGRATVTGVARNVTFREQGLSFRLERFDGAGNRLRPIGVAMSFHMAGGVNDGERVLVRGRWHRGTL